MKRTSKPDKYSAMVRRAYETYHAGRISAATFAMLIGAVWSRRNGT
jgi:hypothetical protein